MDNIGATKELQVSPSGNLFPPEVLQKYYNTGFVWGALSVGGESPSGIMGGLNIVKGLFAQDSRHLTEVKINEISALITALVQQKEKQENALTVCEKIIEEDKASKEDLEKQRDNQSGQSDSTSSSLSVIIVGVSLGLLTLFVFVTYYYIGKVTVVAMIEKEMGIGKSAWVLRVLFPMLALGIGVVFHQFVDRILNPEKHLVVRAGSVLGAVAVLSVAFCLDYFMGYEMTRMAHIKDYNTPGSTSDPWVKGMEKEDIRFYMVLLLSFVSYLLWGILLCYFLIHPKFNKDGDKNKLKIQIARAGKAIAGKEADAVGIRSIVKNLDAALEIRRTELTEYKTRKTFLSKDDLDMAVGKFVEGYRWYVTGYYKRDEHDTSASADNARKKVKMIYDSAEEERKNWVQEVWPI